MDKTTSIKLDELIKNRHDLVAALKKNNDKSHERLAEGLYKKRAHFITELLQNAEDEGAKHVKFLLVQNELVFSHDAPRLFDFGDINSISNFGDNQRKKDKPNAIGRFGIGFKSVYSITDNPRIISGDFDIIIRELCIPERNNKQSSYYLGTKIILPLRNTDIEDTIAFLNNEFKSLNVSYLLFLSNITTIEWQTPNGCGKYEKLPNNNNIVTLKTDNSPIHYLIFEKPVRIENKILVVKIAFYLNEDKSKIIPCGKSPLFAFFPTEEETYASFLLHAPFNTTESRETYDETDTRNNILLAELGGLLSDKLSVIKEKGFINVDFLSILPIDKDICDRSVVYSILYKAVKSEFLKDTNAFIPTNEKSVYCSVNDAMLLGSSELAELLKGKQAKLLFGKSYWITEDITKAKLEKLYKYLHSILSIPNYDLASFATNLTEEFLRTQTDNWIKEFYKVMFHKASGTWKKTAKDPVLRKRPIIRIEENENIIQIIPFTEDGRPNVYLPPELKTGYRTVLRSIANDGTSEEFLKALGLDYPDIFAEINEIVIPRLKKGKMYDDYYNDLAKIISISDNKSDKQATLIEDLRKIPFILGENNVVRTKKLLKYDEVYLPDNNLKLFFSNNPDIFFATDIESFTYEQAKKYKDILKEIGVEWEAPRKLKFASNVSDDAGRIPAGDGSIKSKFEDWELEGLDFFLKNVNSMKKSLVLWHVLLNRKDDFYNGKEERFDKQRSRFSSIHTFDAKFLSDLKKQKWIFIDERRYLPNEITFDDLPFEYREDESLAKKLAEKLGLKLDEDGEFEKRNPGKKVLGLNEYNELMRIKIEKETSENIKRQHDKNKQEFAPTINPADAPIIKPLIFYGSNTNARSYNSRQNNLFDDERNGVGINGGNKGNPTGNGQVSNNTDPPEGANITQNNSKLLKEIGKWGEDYVARILNEEFKNESGIQIINLNADGKTGIGADFEVKKNGKLVRIIEVKTTIGPKKSAVIVSGTQWEMARDIYNCADGDIYWIYCVYNAGTSYVQYTPIQNPIKQWKDGKIMADPINFIIKSV